MADININITSPKGVTLATKKTIVNSNIKMTVDPSLLGSTGVPIETNDMQPIIDNAANNVGNIYKYTGNPTTEYTTGELYMIVKEE